MYIILTHAQANHSPSLDLLIQLKQKLKDLKFIKAQLNITLTLSGYEMVTTSIIHVM